jgi:hypothetical protein
MLKHRHINQHFKNKNTVGKHSTEHHIHVHIYITMIDKQYKLE